MSRIKCLIIDEPYASSVLESYIGELESLEHVGTFYHAIDGLMYLQQNKIDLLFLDIMLPKVTGEAFLELLPCRPRVIFLSDRKKRWKRRNDKYIIDCLVKPITFESFLASVDRYYAAVPQPVMKRGSPGRRRRPAPDRGPFIYLFSGRSVVKVFLDEVLYIEGVKQYTKIKTTEKELIVYQGLTAIEERIAGRGFMRVHRSLIVAISKVTAFTEHTIEIASHILPVSAPYRRQVARLIRAGLRDV
ncbi:LytR/AlgR family response regulator transcription factor [Dyadobacter jiangsuensis]|uniref:LytTR family two component transcriptional regulator n=1 Tax=Dyadobacter jiangsuensis TaxID=1591085 RepID=A0A2P8FMG3_9BACT|nr:LytTR family DNA-binding domain-containing protein [Dyadobacter jiangsuensis]PSL22927.1 LytTR family two component transcriptional regulator [Dyadobacter jiangsuensis]